MKSALRISIIVGVIFLMAAPGWADIINVCYNTRNGEIRYVEDPSDCRRNENPLAINSEGPSGADGISCWDLNSDGDCDPGEDKNGDAVCDANDCQGPEGPEGPPGPSGSFDLSKIYYKVCEGILECYCDEVDDIAISLTVSCDEHKFLMRSFQATSGSGQSGFYALCRTDTVEPFGGAWEGPAESMTIVCIEP